MNGTPAKHAPRGSAFNTSHLDTSTLYIFALMRLPAPLLASTFAESCGAQLHGPDQHIHGVNEIHRVEPGDLTFVDHPKYYRKTLGSAASVILIDRLPEGVTPSGKTLLVRANPFEAYDALIALHRPTVRLSESVLAKAASSPDIDPTAVIEPGAIVGPGVTIGAHTVISAGAVVYGPCVIGAHCRIGANAVIGDEAFYYRGIGGNGRQKWSTGGDVHIEDYVEIGPLCNIARGVGSTTRIGRGTKIDAACMIAHDVVIGEDCLLAAHVGIAGNCRIGNRVVLYGQTGLAQNVEIGDDAVCLARTGVSKSIPGGKTYNGNPVQEAREWLKEIAATRRLARG